MIYHIYTHHHSCALKKLTNRKRRCITLKELSTIHHGIGKLSTSFSLSWFENVQYLVVVRHNTIDLRACGELDTVGIALKLFAGSLCVVCTPFLSQIKSLLIYIFTAVLAGFFSSLGLLRFYFHITIASDGASATNIEYLLLKLNVKTGNFIRDNFLFFNLQRIQEILLRAESCLCPDPKAWGRRLVIVIYMVILVLVSHTQLNLFCLSRVTQKPFYELLCPFTVFCESW